MILPSNMTCFYDVTEFRAFKVEAWRGIGWWGARFQVGRDWTQPILCMAGLHVAVARRTLAVSGER